MANKLVLLLAFVLVLAPLSSAATCAERAYSSSCSRCEFGEGGKMDQSCYQGYQNSGVACLFAAYPLESIQYQGGDCPAIDVCRDRVETCKAIYSNGNDRQDCLTGDIMNCFVQGDICIDAAVKDCKGTPPAQPEFDYPPPAWCDAVFFMFIPVLAGALFCSGKA